MGSGRVGQTREQSQRKILVRPHPVMMMTRSRKNSGGHTIPTSRSHFCYPFLVLCCVHNVRVVSCRLFNIVVLGFVRDQGYPDEILMTMVFQGLYQLCFRFVCGPGRVSLEEMTACMVKPDYYSGRKRNKLSKIARSGALFELKGMRDVETHHPCR